MTSPRIVHIHISSFNWDWLMKEENEKYFSNSIKEIDSGSSKSFNHIGSELILEGIFSTGQCPTQSGITSYYVPRKDKLGVKPLDRSDVNTDFTWELLELSGYKAATLNFNGTHNTLDSTTLSISERFASVPSTNEMDWPVALGSVNCHNTIEKYRDFRWHPNIVNHKELLSMFGENAPYVDNRLKTLILNQMCEQSTIQNIALDLLDNDYHDFIAIRFGILESIRLAIHNFKIQGVAIDSAIAEKIRFNIGWFVDQCIGRVQASLGPSDSLVLTGGGDKPFVIMRGSMINEDELFSPSMTVFDVVPSILAIAGQESKVLSGISQICASQKLEQIQCYDSLQHENVCPTICVDHAAFDLAEATPSAACIKELEEVLFAKNLSLYHYAIQTNNEQLARQMHYRLLPYSSTAD